MARRRVRRAGRRGRRLRAYGRRAASIFSKPSRFIGFKKDGFHASDAVIAGGLIGTFVLPAASSPESSALGCLMGQGGYSSWSWSARLTQAMHNACVVGLGVNMKGQKETGGYAGVGGMAVLGGVGMKVAGRVINPLMKGSAVKL